jgi:peroxiredoxin
MQFRSSKFAAIDRRTLLISAAGLALLPWQAALATEPYVFAHTYEHLPAPDFSLEDVDRKLWQLSALRGQVVVVNFWATWCPPCKRELPSLESLYQTVARKRVVVLGINAGENWETVTAFTAGLKSALTFPILMDKKGAVMHAWQVKAPPSTYVVDRGGRIVLRALGGRDFSRPDAIEDVTKLALES